MSIGTMIACRGDSQNGQRPPQCSVSTAERKEDKKSGEEEKGNREERRGEERRGEERRGEATQIVGEVKKERG